MLGGGAGGRGRPELGDEAAGIGGGSDVTGRVADPLGAPGAMPFDGPGPLAGGAGGIGGGCVFGPADCGGIAVIRAGLRDGAPCPAAESAPCADFERVRSGGGAVRGPVCGG